MLLSSMESCPFLGVVEGKLLVVIKCADSVTRTTHSSLDAELRGEKKLGRDLTSNTTGMKSVIDALM